MVRTTFVPWISSDGILNRFRSSTIRSASFPTSREPVFSSSPRACAPLMVRISGAVTVISHSPSSVEAER